MKIKSFPSGDTYQRQEKLEPLFFRKGFMARIIELDNMESCSRRGSYAHAKIMDELKKGTIKKQPCEKCGKKAHAHHPNYDFPLRVRWLCPLHHMRAHLYANLTKIGKFISQHKHELKHGDIVCAGGRNVRVK